MGATDSCPEISLAKRCFGKVPGPEPHLPKQTPFIPGAKARLRIRLAITGRNPWPIGRPMKPRPAEKFTGTLSELWGDMAPQPQRGNSDDSKTGAGFQERRDMGTSRDALT